MKIEKDKVVRMDYTLKSDEGEVIDTSEGNAPLAYLQGHGNIIPGLEKEMEGKAAGDEVKVSIKPEDGYGERRDDLIQEIPKDNFDPGQQIEVGMQFQVETEAGPLVVMVKEVKDDSIVLDGNHPLAGVNLNFEVKVVEVRDATSEELAHGHPHSPGGHNH